MPQIETSTKVGYCWACGGAQTIKVTTTTTIGSQLYQKVRSTAESCDRCGTQLERTRKTIDVRTPVS